MFRRLRNARRASRLAQPADLAGEISDRVADQWEAWRRSAQAVTRAWNEWLAAGGREQGERYRRYARVLADEEQAAVQLERAMASGTARESAAGRLVRAGGGTDTCDGSAGRAAE